jgi:hypothetical protein
MASERRLLAAAVSRRQHHLQYVQEVAFETGKMRRVTSTAVWMLRLRRGNVSALQIDADGTITAVGKRRVSWRAAWSDASRGLGRTHLVRGVFIDAAGAGDDRREDSQ